MTALSGWTWALDGWIVAAGVLCAVSAALLGNFLVLRKMSMLGDAITHAVLPGLAVAFLVSGSRNSLPMFVGALIAGIATAFMTEWIRKVGRVDEGASMGVVFTSLFALGLVMIVQAVDHVHLDPGCVLYGAIEMTPLNTWTIGGYEIPQTVVILSIVTAINLLFVLMFLKELKISSFDPALATTTGFPAWVMHYALMVLVAVTSVAGFESVGNILVVAMFVVPPAAAHLLTDRLSTMILLSVVFAALSAVLGHIGAIVIPAQFGYRSTTTAGMMAVAAGVLFALAALLGPRHGIVARLIRGPLLAWRILQEDIVALLFRIEERGNPADATSLNLRKILLSDRTATTFALAWLDWQDLVERSDSLYRLTEPGRSHARTLVRSHRLWEQYLAARVGVASDRLHGQAERLEHFTDRRMREELDVETEVPQLDPHGRSIPREEGRRPSPNGPAN